MTESAKLKNILESLLFVAKNHVTLDELEQATMFPKGQIADCLAEMGKEYLERGIRITKVAGGYSMGTNPDNVDYVEKVLHPKEETTLSPQALETLAIIAYRQPVTRTEIERLRGVNSDYIVESLLNKKLIKEMGRSEAVGHPYLYGTHANFLHHFGLHDLTDLPALPQSETAQEALFKSALKESEAAAQIEASLSA